MTCPPGRWRSGRSLRRTVPARAGRDARQADRQADGERARGEDGGRRHPLPVVLVPCCGWGGRGRWLGRHTDVLPARIVVQTPARLRDETHDAHEECGDLRRRGAFPAARGRCGGAGADGRLVVAGSLVHRRRPGRPASWAGPASARRTGSALQQQHRRADLGQLVVQVESRHAASRCSVPSETLVASRTCMGWAALTRRTRVAGRLLDRTLRRAAPLGRNRWGGRRAPAGDPTVADSYLYVPPSPPRPPPWRSRRSTPAIFITRPWSARS